ncbi:uncharacterized protein LOC143257173 isoform X2 [Tachypleus tridentatus]|uniref:uncharacterized protein LOC143257173 isoform X2 n=1 Tax=Tachypleus tridentatus TaxID=6853 RepID=UPI003FD2030D
MVQPTITLSSLREVFSKQLGQEVVPSHYVFLRHVGRNFTQVKDHQEKELKVKNYLPPFTSDPEIFIKEKQNTISSGWSQEHDSGVDIHEQRSFQDESTDGSPYNISRGVQSLIANNLISPEGDRRVTSDDRASRINHAINETNEFNILSRRSKQSNRLYDCGYEYLDFSTSTTSSADSASLSVEANNEGGQNTSYFKKITEDGNLSQNPLEELLEYNIELQSKCGTLSKVIKQLTETRVSGQGYLALMRKKSAKSCTNKFKSSYKSRLPVPIGRLKRPFSVGDRNNAVQKRSRPNASGEYKNRSVQGRIRPNTTDEYRNSPVERRSRPNTGVIKNSPTQNKSSFYRTAHTTFQAKPNCARIGYIFDNVKPNSGRNRGCHKFTESNSESVKLSGLPKIVQLANNVKLLTRTSGDSDEIQHIESGQLIFPQFSNQEVLVATSEQIDRLTTACRKKEICRRKTQLNKHPYCENLAHLREIDNMHVHQSDKIEKGSDQYKNVFSLYIENERDIENFQNILRQTDKAVNIQRPFLIKGDFNTAIQLEWANGKYSLTNNILTVAPKFSHFQNIAEKNKQKRYVVSSDNSLYHAGLTDTEMNRKPYKNIPFSVRDVVCRDNSPHQPELTDTEVNRKPCKHIPLPVRDVVHSDNSPRHPELTDTEVNRKPCKNISLPVRDVVHSGSSPHLAELVDTEVNRKPCKKCPLPVRDVVHSDSSPHQSELTDTNKVNRKPCKNIPLPVRYVIHSDSSPHLAELSDTEENWKPYKNIPLPMRDVIYSDSSPHLAELTNTEEKRKPYKNIPLLVRDVVHSDNNPHQAELTDTEVNRKPCKNIPLPVRDVIHSDSSPHLAELSDTEENWKPYKNIPLPMRDVVHSDSSPHLTELTDTEVNRKPCKKIPLPMRDVVHSDSNPHQSELTDTNKVNRKPYKNISLPMRDVIYSDSSPHLAELTDTEEKRKPYKNIPLLVRDVVHSDNNPHQAELTDTEVNRKPCKNIPLAVRDVIHSDSSPHLVELTDTNKVNRKPYKNISLPMRDVIYSDSSPHLAELTDTEEKRKPYKNIPLLVRDVVHSDNNPHQAELTDTEVNRKPCKNIPLAVRDVIHSDSSPHLAELSDTEENRKPYKNIPLSVRDVVHSDSNPHQAELTDTEVNRKPCKNISLAVRDVIHSDSSPHLVELTDTEVNRKPCKNIPLPVRDVVHSDNSPHLAELTDTEVNRKSYNSFLLPAKRKFNKYIPYFVKDIVNNNNNIHVVQLSDIGEENKKTTLVNKGHLVPFSLIKDDRKRLAEHQDCETWVKIDESSSNYVGKRNDVEEWKGFATTVGYPESFNMLSESTRETTHEEENLTALSERTKQKNFHQNNKIMEYELSVKGNDTDVKKLNCELVNSRESRIQNDLLNGEERQKDGIMYSHLNIGLKTEIERNGLTQKYTKKLRENCIYESKINDKISHVSVVKSDSITSKDSCRKSPIDVTMGTLKLVIGNKVSTGEPVTENKVSTGESVTENKVTTQKTAMGKINTMGSTTKDKQKPTKRNKVSTAEQAIANKLSTEEPSIRNKITTPKPTMGNRMSTGDSATRKSVNTEEPVTGNMMIASKPTIGNEVSSVEPAIGNKSIAPKPATGNKVSSEGPATGNIMAALKPAAGNEVSSVEPATGNKIIAPKPATGNKVSSVELATGNKMNTSQLVRGNKLNTRELAIESTFNTEEQVLGNNNSIEEPATGKKFNTLKAVKGNKINAPEPVKGNKFSTGELTRGKNVNVEESATVNKQNTEEPLTEHKFSTGKPVIGNKINASQLVRGNKLGTGNPGTGNFMNVGEPTKVNQEDIGKLVTGQSEAGNKENTGKVAIENQIYASEPVNENKLGTGEPTTGKNMDVEESAIKNTLKIGEPEAVNKVNKDESATENKVNIGESAILYKLKTGETETGNIVNTREPATENKLESVTGSKVGTSEPTVENNVSISEPKKRNKLIIAEPVTGNNVNISEPLMENKKNLKDMKNHIINIQNVSYNTYGPVNTNELLTQCSTPRYPSNRGIMTVVGHLKNVSELCDAVTSTKDITNIQESITKQYSVLDTKLTSKHKHTKLTQRIDKYNEAIENETSSPKTCIDCHLNIGLTTTSVARANDCTIKISEETRTRDSNGIVETDKQYVLNEQNILKAFCRGKSGPNTENNSAEKTYNRYRQGTLRKYNTGFRDMKEKTRETIAEKQKNGNEDSKINFLQSTYNHVELNSSTRPVNDVITTGNLQLRRSLSDSDMLLSERRIRTRGDRSTFKFKGKLEATSSFDLTRDTVLKYQLDQKYLIPHQLRSERLFVRQKNSPDKSIWKEKYLKERKKTTELERECTKNRNLLEKFHRDLLAKLEVGIWNNVLTGKAELPSKKLSAKIAIARLLQEIEDLKSRVESTNFRHKAEIKLRYLVQDEVKILRRNLVKKKIQITLLRNQEQCAVDISQRDSFISIL